jgi:hypothetical protein
MTSSKGYKWKVFDAWWAPQFAIGWQVQNDACRIYLGFYCVELEKIVG